MDKCNRCNKDLIEAHIEITVNPPINLCGLSECQEPISTTKTTSREEWIKLKREEARNLPKKECEELFLKDMQHLNPDRDCYCEFLGYDWDGD